MLIQPAMNKLSSENYRLKNQNNTPMFRGEFGTKVLKAIEDAGIKDKEAIQPILSELGVGRMGLVAMSKLTDILEEVLTIIARGQELNKKEQSLINVERLLKQSETEELQSSMRAFYGIKDPEIKTYDSFGEQCIAVINIINQNRKCNEHTGVVVDDFNDTNINNLVQALQNVDKKITSETLDVLKKITAMHDYSLKTLSDIVTILQDDFGDIDFNKSAYFLALYSLDKATLTSAAENTANAFNVNIGKIRVEALEKLIENLEKNVNYHPRLRMYATELSNYNLRRMNVAAIKDIQERISNILNQVYRDCCDDSRDAYNKLEAFYQKCKCL